MTSWHSYPKIYNFGHAAVEPILDSLCDVEEKIDGSQFSFGVIDGELRCRSRGQQLVVDAPEKMFGPAVETARSLADRLVPGWTYRGETLTKPKHNTLAYSRVPINNIILFDVNTGEEAYLSHEEKKIHSIELGLECVDLVCSLNPKLVGAEVILNLLDRESALGGVKIEGVVLKPVLPIFGPDGKAIMAKFVSEDFKESHQTQWRVNNPTNSDIVAVLGEALRTEARWMKAIQRRRDCGDLLNQPQDIGPLLKGIQEDVEDEEAIRIKDELYKYFWPHIRRKVVAGFPEWYKEKLMKDQLS